MNSFKKFALSKTQPNIKINREILEELKSYLIDLVVYGEDKACTRYSLFEEINSEFASKEYILREFPTNSAKEDISMNRCAIESSGFLPEKFKLEYPTPGKPNDCTGPNFLLENDVPVNMVYSYADDFDEFEDASCSNEATCSASIQPINSDDNNVIERAIHAANKTSTSDSCTDLMLHPDGSNRALTLMQENSRKRHISAGNDHLEEPEWLTTKFFRLIKFSSFLKC